MRAKSAFVYSLLRLLAFFVPFGIMMLFPAFQEQYWLAAIFAALIGLSLSILFLRRPLDEVSVGLTERRAEKRRLASDEAVEDATIGDATDTGSTVTGSTSTGPAAAASTGRESTAPASDDERPEQDRAVRD